MSRWLVVVLVWSVCWVLIKTQNVTETPTWTWLSGRGQLYTPGIYGIKGIPSTSNMPGARYYATGWFDSFANEFWLFGGYGADCRGTLGMSLLLTD